MSPQPVIGALGASGIAGRVVGAAGLAAVGLLHVLWAAGSSWPARDADALADAVVGSAHVPAAGPTAGVAALALGGAAIVSGAGGDRPVARLIRAGAAAALLARGLAGGVVATRVLRLPDPSARFRDLDRLVYRPLCLVLGAAVAWGSLGRIRRRKMG
ncbi:DUF3995 domain-containing protein [Microbacterium sp. NPDC089698]|uniref:DUF3995 domain-containing protein n=1 Tax=Microbacterium sp. NPDC089698 TaxID=3364200 RepID=UPI0037FD13C7